MDEPSGSTTWSQHGLISPTSASNTIAFSQKTIRPVRDYHHPRLPSPADGPRLGQYNHAVSSSVESLERLSSPSYDPPSRSFSRHDRSTSSSSFTTPPGSASTAPSSGQSHTPSSALPLPLSLAAAGHSRGASYTATQRLSANLSAKKSLPDLRQSHAKIIQDRREGGQEVEDIRPLGLGINNPNRYFRPAGNGWGTEMVKTPTGSPISSDRGRGLSRKGSADMLRKMKHGMGLDLAERRGSQDGPLVDESRNSYFRRLSTLPVSSLSKAIPPSLLNFIDAIRGVLFALSQLHTALRQYLLFAVHERTAGLFARVMEPASVYMSNLINALDRFDSMSRRHSPPIHAIRGVLNAAKESVAVFHKIVAVLGLQIPAFKGGDVRYTRTLLTMIYGSMAEVACSWRTMAPLLSEIKSLLAVAGQGSVARALIGGHKMIPTGSLTGRTPISPIPERGESHSPPSVPRPSVPMAISSPLQHKLGERPASPPVLGAGDRTRSRRQGGSFSTQDVEKGMMMGSPGGLRHDEQANAYFRHRPSESAQIVLGEQAEESEAGEERLVSVPPFEVNATGSIDSVRSIPITPPEHPQLPQPITMVSASSNASKRGHGPHSSSGSSHALSLSSAMAPHRKLSVDIRPITPAPATLFDEDLLDMIETATDFAFNAWMRLAQDIGSSSPSHGGYANHAKSDSYSSDSSQLDSDRGEPSSVLPIDASRHSTAMSASQYNELVQLLAQAEQITMVLRESTLELRANPLNYAHTRLPDDAQAFIKTVVKVSELVKIISTSHVFPPNVRQSCSRLTQATRECAILIQVSSLRPGNATPAPIPSATARSSSSAHVSRGSGPDSSTEDLYLPPSASYQPPSAGWGQPPREGLRGLRLPGRLAFGRSRSANAVPPDPQMVIGRGGSHGEVDGYFGPISATREAVPKSAQARQVAF